MPGGPRSDVVRDGEIATYHCWTRCAQQLWLYGEDPLTGINYDHRREWVQKLLKYQTSIFSVEIGNYSILSNHQHLIARTRPDIAATWSDEDVALRWKLAWPKWIDDQWVREPTDQEVEELLLQPEKVSAARHHLSSLSWFMARWKEPIAKLANQESGRKGHFYAGRYGCRELEGDGAALCCSVYLDLNQLKAGKARSLEESNYSAIQDRLRAWQKQEAAASVEKFYKKAGDQCGGPYTTATADCLPLSQSRRGTQRLAVFL